MKAKLLTVVLLSIVLTGLAAPMPLTEDTLRQMQQTLKNFVDLDVPVRLEKVNAMLQSLQGELELIRHDLKQFKLQAANRLSDFGARLHHLESSAASRSATVQTRNIDTSDIQLLLSTSEKAMKQKQFSVAKVGFLRVIKRAKAADALGLAHFRLAQIARQEGHDHEAVRQCNLVIAQYPKHQLVPDAMYCRVVLEMRLHQSANARKTYQQLAQVFPHSHFVGLARQALHAEHSAKSS